MSNNILEGRYSSIKLELDVSDRLKQYIERARTERGIKLSANAAINAILWKFFKEEKEGET